MVLLVETWPSNLSWLWVGGAGSKASLLLSLCSVLSASGPPGLAVLLQAAGPRPHSLATEGDGRDTERTVVFRWGGTGSGFILKKMTPVCERKKTGVRETSLEATGLARGELAGA